MKERLRYLRKLTGLSRVGVEKSTNKKISASNLGALEDGLSNPNYKMLIKLINFYESKSIYIDYRWLLVGQGNKPFVKDEESDFVVNLNSIKESSYFEKINEDSMIVTIPSNSFSPKFNKGDLVGAVAVSERIFENDYIIIPEEDNKIYRINSVKINNNIIHLLFKNNDLFEKHINTNDVKKFYNIVWTRRSNL